MEDDRNASIETLQFELWKRGVFIEELHERLRNYSARMEELYACRERSKRLEALVAEMTERDQRTSSGQEIKVFDGVDFVQQVYRGILGRAPDEPGMTFYLERLSNGWTIADVLHATIHSEEFRIMYLQANARSESTP